LSKRKKNGTGEGSTRGKTLGHTKGAKNDPKKGDTYRIHRTAEEPMQGLPTKKKKHENDRGIQQTKGAWKGESSTKKIKGKKTKNETNRPSHKTCGKGQNV